MIKLSTIILITVAFLLLAGGCSSDKPESTGKTTPAEVAQRPAETKVADVSANAAEIESNGEALFTKHCLKCHKNGGNIINKEKPIDRASLADRNITTPEDIVKVMRNPGPKMNRFDESKISDKEALKIGEYILKTFE
jgi:mono/diheme cytochrome c family protein